LRQGGCSKWKHLGDGGVGPADPHLAVRTDDLPLPNARPQRASTSVPLTVEAQVTPSLAHPQASHLVQGQDPTQAGALAETHVVHQESSPRSPSYSDVGFGQDGYSTLPLVPQTPVGNTWPGSAQMSPDVVSERSFGVSSHFSGSNYLTGGDEHTGTFPVNYGNFSQASDFDGGSQPQPPFSPSPSYTNESTSPSSSHQMAINHQHRSEDAFANFRQLTMVCHPGGNIFIYFGCHCLGVIRANNIRGVPFTDLSL